MLLLLLLKGSNWPRLKMSSATHIIVSAPGVNNSPLPNVASDSLPSVSCLSRLLTGRLHRDRVSSSITLPLASPNVSHWACWAMIAVVGRGEDGDAKEA